jgi:hypothetical protein
MGKSSLVKATYAINNVDRKPRPFETDRIHREEAKPAGAMAPLRT